MLVEGERGREGRFFGLVRRDEEAVVVGGEAIFFHLGGKSEVRCRGFGWLVGWLVGSREDGGLVM